MAVWDKAIELAEAEEMWEELKQSQPTESNTPSTSRLISV